LADIKTSKFSANVKIDPRGSENGERRKTFGKFRIVSSEWFVE
jgi:hypothetical protein